MPSSNRPTDGERNLFALDPRRRRADHTIRLMRESNPTVFNEICRRLLNGETVAGVSTWLWHLRPRGFLGTLSYNTLRCRYVDTLQRRLRQQVADQAERTHDDPPPPAPPPPPMPRPSDTEAVLERVQETVREVTRPRTPHVTDELRLMVDQRVAEIRAMEMLKYCFFQQDRRLRRHLTLEEQGEGLLSPEGNMAIDVMRKIAEAVAKIEFGENLISVKRLHNGINPSGVDGMGPESIAQRDAIIRQFDSLSAVDKNLVREASNKFIDMVREDYSGSTSRGLGSANTSNEQQASGVPQNR